MKCFRHYFEKARKKSNSSCVQSVSVLCVSTGKSCWAVFPTPSHFELSVWCGVVCVCVCVDSRYQNSWCFFFQGLSFPHPLWPSERGERVQGTFWHSSTASRLTCAAKKEAHTKKRDFEGAFFSFLFTYRERRGKQDR